jgi:hypothetical protein
MMTDDTLDTAVESFFEDVDETLEEYDRGYADADATLRVLRAHLDELREAAEE